MKYKGPAKRIWDETTKAMRDETEGDHMTKTFYLAGPMSGLPQFNFPAFYAATAALRARGYTIVSPAELDDQEDAGAAMASKDGDPNNRDTMDGKTWGDFLARDVKLIADQVKGIIFLRDWHKSKGAKLEAYVGLLCKYEFWFYLGDGRVEKARPADILVQLYAHTDDEYET